MIQVFKGGEWRKVTSVEFDPNRQHARRIGDNTLHNRESAFRAAMRSLTGWQDSHQFTGLDLRIAEGPAYRAAIDTVVVGRKEVADA